MRPPVRTSLCTSGAIRRSAKLTLSRASCSGLMSSSVFFMFIPRHQCKLSQVFNHFLVASGRQEAEIRQDDVVEPFMVGAKFGFVRYFYRKRESANQGAMHRSNPIRRRCAVPSTDPVFGRDSKIEDDRGKH